MEMAYRLQLPIKTFQCQRGIRKEEMRSLILRLAFI